MIGFVFISPKPVGLYNILMAIKGLLGSERAKNVGISEDWISQQAEPLC